MAKDYYEILGVGRDATSDEIKRAFRRIARATHPDANPGDPASEARFKDAAEAYEVLSDPDRRRRYDRGDTIDLSDLFGGWGGFDDLLRSVFGEGQMFGGGAQGRPPRGRDVLIRVDVDLEGAAFGTEAPVSFRTKSTCLACAGTGAEGDDGRSTCPECGGSGSVRMARRSLFGTMMTVGACPTCRGEGVLVTNPCPVCSGVGTVDEETTVTVEVPAGVSTGTRLRLSGRGESGGRNGPSGDLYVEVHVTPDPRFERHEADLIHRLTIGIAEAALGARVTVPLVEGGTTDVDIPAGTQPGAVFRLAGHGVTQLGRRSRGDLHVVVSVEVPTDLTTEEEEILRRWADLRGERTDRPASAS
ncbi:MAG TPA: molecular chaperone DnaJ [Acidimicrobiia bacterium]|nr:molecular chaperone DnaJ [Acidimicrobiia bacterium]